jgi:hypothetical protein
MSEAAELSANISVNDRRYQDVSKFDLQTILTTLGYKYKTGETTLGFNYRFADAKLDGQGFLSLTQYSPSVSTFLSKQHFVRVAYTFIEKKLDDNPTRDSDSNEVAVDYYYFKNGLSQYFIFASRIRDEDALKNEFDFRSIQFRAAYKQRYTVLKKLNKLTIDYTHRNRDYDTATNPMINENRQDKRNTFGIENETVLSNRFSVTAEIQYIDNTSNLNSFDFSETVSSLGITYQF